MTESSELCSETSLQSMQMRSFAISSASSSLLTGPSQNRQKCQLYVTMTHLLHANLSGFLIPGGFTVLQTHGYFVSPMLEQKPLANAPSLTVLQNNGIFSLLISVRCNATMPSKLCSKLISTRSTAVSHLNFCLLPFGLKGENRLEKTNYMRVRGENLLPVNERREPVTCD